MFRSACLALTLLMSGLIPASAAKRALVIGNNSYTELPDLRKAIADADAYDSVLSGLGYSVTLETDLSTTAMQRVIGEFIDSIAPGDEVAFVFAGHGWSDGSTNYIVGSDTAAQTSISTLRRAAIPLRNGANGVIDDMQSQGARLVLAVVDACRNNPFQSKLGRSGSVGLSRGLSLVAPVSGTFTVFSAGAGQEALDRLDENDTHPNSVFSRVFLKELSEGGSLQDIVLDTAPRVAELADGIGHVQRPAYYDGIGQRYCLTEGCQQREETAAVVAPPSVIAETVIEADVPGFWASLRATDSDTVVVVSEPEPAPTPTQAVEVVPLPAVKPDLEVALLPSPAPSTEQPVEVQPIQELAILLPTEPVAPPALVPMTRDASPAAPIVDLSSDPYFRPDPVPQPTLQTARVQPSVQSVGAPVQFIVRGASPIRTVNQLDRESICSVERTPQQPTIDRFFQSRSLSHHNRRFRNLGLAVKSLERNRCNALAVPPRLVNRVIGMVRDPSRYIVLPEIVR